MKWGKATVRSSGSRGKNVPGYSTRLLSTGNSGCQASASQIECKCVCWNKRRARQSGAKRNTLPADWCHLFLDKMTGGLASLSINYSGVISALLTCAQVWQVTFVCSLPYCQRGQQFPISLSLSLSVCHSLSRWLRLLKSLPSALCSSVLCRVEEHHVPRMPSVPRHGHW